MNAGSVSTLRDERGPVPLRLVTEPDLFDGPCWQPHEETIRALMVEHDKDRALLRAQTAAYRQQLVDNGIEPLDDTGADLLDAYHRAFRALTVVLRYFGGDGWTLERLPAELRPAFEGLPVH